VGKFPTWTTPLCPRLDPRSLIIRPIPGPLCSPERHEPHDLGTGTCQCLRAPRRRDPRRE